MAGTLGETPDDDEELLDDERAPPSREPLSKELTDAVEDVMAEAKTAPKPVDSETTAKRLFRNLKTQHLELGISEFGDQLGDHFGQRESNLQDLLIPVRLEDRESDWPPAKHTHT